MRVDLPEKSFVCPHRQHADSLLLHTLSAHVCSCRSWNQVEYRNDYVAWYQCRKMWNMVSNSTMVHKLKRFMSQKETLDTIRSLSFTRASRHIASFNFKIFSDTMIVGKFSSTIRCRYTFPFAKSITITTGHTAS